MSEDTRIERAREIAVSAAERSYDATARGDSVVAVAIARNNLRKIERILSEPAPQPEPKRHQWSRDGETCVVCGDKDWMGGPCKPAPQPESEDGERVLLWDKTNQSFKTDPRPACELTTNYRKAYKFPGAAARRMATDNPSAYALADLSAWVASWGEQPVGDGEAVEAIAGDGTRYYVHAGDADWEDITHFRLPAPSDCGTSTEDECPTCGTGPREPCRRTDDVLSECQVRRIVDERLAADHRRMAEMQQHSAYQRSIHKCRANELDGGEDG